MAQVKPAIDTVWGSTGATTDPGTTKMNLGWTAEIPTHNVQNFWQQRVDEFLTHVNEQGIAVWDTVTTYPLDAWAKGSDGEVYVALQIATAQDPISAPAFWELLSEKINPAGSGSTGNNANGYFKIADDGTISQWGVTTVSASSTAVTFPVAFTTLASISVTAIPHNTGGDTGGSDLTPSLRQALTTGGCNFSTRTSDAAIGWMAQGK